MSTIKIPNQVIPDDVCHIDEYYTEEYKKLVEEADKKIDEDQRRKVEAWRRAKYVLARSYVKEENNNKVPLKKESGLRLVKRK